MPLASLGQAFLTLLLLLVAAVPVRLTQEHVPEAAHVVPEEELSEEAKIQIGTQKVMQAVGKLLGDYNSGPLSGLPTININSDKISVSISLANIYLQGLSDMELLEAGAFSGSRKNKTAHGTVMFNKISLLVGTYSSTGHINNLPFNGEGPMYIHLHDFSISFSIKWHFEKFNLCVEYNTSHLTLDLLRMETHFEHLNTNEGADLGQLVDIVVPSFGQDIVKQLEVLLSTTYYEKLDTILVGYINTITKCTKGTREDILNTAQLMEMTHDIIKDLIP